MFSLLLLLRRIFFFWETAARRAELHRDMQSTYNMERAKMDTGQDFFLKRDMDRLKEEEKRKQE